jgi:hypothetical protein
MAQCRGHEDCVDLQAKREHQEVGSGTRQHNTAMDAEPGV